LLAPRQGCLFLEQGGLLAISIFGITITSTTNCFAQTQTVTLAVNSQNPSSPYAVATNQVVQIISLASENRYVPYVKLYHFSGMTVFTSSIGTYTGLTNISVNFSGSSGLSQLVTLTITTPSTPLVISNYIPADAIVIPASATGNVQIILESSPDLVNWTAASPGTYGASAGTNRFFRVRAAVIP
jgi:hypothetical protein